MSKQRKLKLRKKELVWYVIAGILAVVGLVFLVFGIVGDHLPVTYKDNWIYTSQAAWLTNWSGLGYRYWGIILFGAAAIIAATALTLFAREGDRDSERAQRRAQRLAIEAEPLPEEPKAE